MHKLHNLNLPHSYANGGGNPLPENLHCPVCGCQYLHHFHVEIFERSEDAENGIHVSVMAGSYTTQWQIMGKSFPDNPARPSIKIDEEMRGNPSSRRQGIIIRFLCEECSHVSTLSFAQHKGFTCVEFK